VLPVFNRPQLKIDKQRAIAVFVFGQIVGKARKLFFVFLICFFLEEVRLVDAGQLCFLEVVC
jgi:hypothetical protein